MSEQLNPIDEMIADCDAADQMLKDLKAYVSSRAQLWQVKATLLLVKENQRIANALELIYKYIP